MAETSSSADEIREWLRTNEAEREDLLRQLAEAESKVSPGESGPACTHIAMPDGTPLCRYATREAEYLPPDAHAEMNREEFASWLDRNTDLPACGPCVMIAGNLRFRATVLRGMCHDKVYPERPQDAWRLLAGTAWGQSINIAGSLAHMDTLAMSYTWGDNEVDAAQVKTHVAEKNRESLEIRKAMLDRHEEEAAARRDRNRPDYEGL